MATETKEREWDVLSTRPADNVPAMLKELGAFLATEKGMPVKRPDVIAIAVREALERRKAAK